MTEHLGSETAAGLAASMALETIRRELHHFPLFVTRDHEGMIECRFKIHELDNRLEARGYWQNAGAIAYCRDGNPFGYSAITLTVDELAAVYVHARDRERSRLDERAAGGSGLRVR